MTFINNNNNNNNAGQQGHKVTLITATDLSYAFMYKKRYI